MKKFSFKNLLLFILFFFIYIIPYFFINRDLNFYDSLNKIPIPSIVFSIVWTILYSLISFYLIKNYKDLLNKKRLLIYIIINYFSNVLYVLFFFQFKLLFLPFVMCCTSFISILFVWMETILFSKKLSYLIIPNVIWSLFACVLSGYVFLFN